jgi:hypothetical protein
MRETEIRSILSHVCKKLDNRARRSAASAMLGASLLVTTGCSDDPGLDRDGDAAVDSGTNSDSGAVPAYMAPVDSGVTDSGNNNDIDSGAVTKYMGPPVDSGSDLDAGAVAEYAAPMDSGSDIDAGAVAEYAAPIDSGPIPPYMVQLPDADDQPIDAGDYPVYIAPEVSALKPS